jgi:hypothetical protein
MQTCEGLTWLMSAVFEPAPGAKLFRFFAPFLIELQGERWAEDKQKART